MGRQQPSLTSNELPKHYNDWPNSIGFDTTYVEREPIELEVSGRIPTYVAGTLFRTGAGQRSVDTRNGPSFRVHHWFDNLSVNHRFQLIPREDGQSCRVIYNSRSTCDGLIARIKETGVGDEVTFGSKYDPCMTFFQKVQSCFKSALVKESASPQPNEVSVAVTMSCNFPGLSRTGESDLSMSEKPGIRSLCNKTDYNIIQMLDPETLEPIGIASQRKLHPELKGQSSAAHMQSDPVTGDVFNFNLEFASGKGIYRIFTVNAVSGNTSILATITAPPAYIHSFFLTKNYIIFCVWNSFFEYGGASVMWKKNIIDALRYDASQPARWYVVDRLPSEHGGRGLITTYESNAFFCFHSINAYETVERSADGTTKTDIIADLCAFENMDILKRFYFENLTSDSPTAAPFSDPSNQTSHPMIRRYRLPCIESSTTTTTSTTSNAPAQAAILEFSAPRSASLELPTTNPSYTTNPYRYVYGSSDTGKSTFMDGVTKFDMLTRRVVATWSVFGHCAGEPIFVGDPARDREEDGGVLLTVVLDGFSESSYLLVLDAKDLSEVGRATARGAIGFGFHGTHFPATLMAKL